MQARINQVMTDSVSIGVRIDHVDGSARAWAYMASHNVPREVILRVLASSARRNDDPGIETLGLLTRTTAIRLASSTMPLKIDAPKN